MSAGDLDCGATDAGLCEFPEFDLRAVLDDEDEPGQVTLFPAGVDESALATTWITVDVDAAVPLPDAR